MSLTRFMIQDLRFKNKTKKNFGFSLVELLIVVTIILVLTGIGSYSIGKFNRMKETTELREYITDRLKLARNLSITNQLPDKTVDLKYVKVTITNNNLKVEGINKNDDTGTTESPYFSEKLDNSGDQITITNNSVSVDSFGFLGKSGRLTDNNGGLSNGPLLIKISNQSGEYGLTINDLGLIDNE